jgi:hypothetical protein
MGREPQMSGCSLGPRSGTDRCVVQKLGKQQPTPSCTPARTHAAHVEGKKGAPNVGIACHIRNCCVEAEVLVAGIEDQGDDRDLGQIGIEVEREVGVEQNGVVMLGIVSRRKINSFGVQMHVV